MPSSFSELNTYSDTVLTFTDLRTAKVVFDRATPTAQTASYVTAGTWDVPIGINITEIILPDTEQVYFQVNVSNVTGATVSWPSLPAGYSVTTIGAGVYRVSNIQSRADWDLIKLARVTMPAGYKANFNATAFIGYETSLTKSWTIAVQATSRALLTSSTSIYANGGYIVDNSLYQNQLSRFTLAATATKVKRTTAALTSTSTITRARGGFQKLFQSAVTARFTMATVAIKPKVAISAVTASSIMVTIADKITYVTNITQARSYRSNQGQPVFASSVPYITDTTTYPSDIYYVTMIPSNGSFGELSYDTAGTFTYSGTGADVNAYLNQIYFYPTTNFSSNTSFIFRIRNAGSVSGSTGWTQLSFTIAMNYAGAATDTYLTFGVGTTNWTPTYSQKKYHNSMEFLLVGGGGGGGGYYSSPAYASGGGGAAGEVVYLSNTIFGLPFYTLTVGARGLFSRSTSTRSGSNGGLSSFNGYTASGGGAGTATEGGSNGTYSGGASIPPQYSGGGAGSAEGAQRTPQSGTSPYDLFGTGGDGTINAITGTSLYYAAGGGGGGSGSNGTGNGTFPTPGCGGRGGFSYTFPGDSGPSVAPPTDGQHGTLIVRLL